MDVLKPDLQYIDGICYRINPGNITVNFDPGNRPQYIEQDVEECVYENILEDEEFDIEVDASGRYRTNFHIAKVYFPFIIGSKGGTKKRIETETRTRITIPKLGQDGDIVVTGADRKNVASARRRVNMLALSARRKQPFTHFVSLPFVDQQFKNSFQSFKKEVLEKCKDRGIDESIFQSVDKLHLTLGTLVLVDDKERQDASAALNYCKEKVIRPLMGDKPLKLKMEGIEYMNDDPSEVDILYGKVTCPDNPDFLQEFADTVVEFFIHEGLMDKQYEKVKLHVTLMNTLFRQKGEEEKGTKRETFDARTVLKEFETYRLGEGIANSLEISLRYSTGKSGYYQATASIQLP